MRSLLPPLPLLLPLALPAGCLTVGEPTIDALSLKPPVVTDAGPVTALVSASDPDGEPVSLEYRWYVNGQLAGTEPTLSNEAFSRGDTLKIEVIPSDGWSVGRRRVLEIVVDNAPPSAPVAEILPRDAIWGRDALSCEAAVPSVDPDGDPVRYRTIWTVDGAPFAGPVLGRDTTLGRQWRCALVPSDGQSEGPAGVDTLAPPPSLSNLLVVMLDDIGNDRPAFIGEHPVPSVTPRLDRLAAEGVFFRNMYSTPLCSPSRALAFTGRHGRRNGMGHIVDHHLWQVELPRSELTVFEALKLGPAPYENSFVGKFHVTSAVSGLTGPLQHGLDWYAGPLGNPSEPPGAGYAWFLWGKDDNGTFSEETTYITTDTIDDAIARIGVMAEPWLLWVALNAVHAPLHRPPEALRPNTPLEADASDFEKHRAILEAADTELGRLLDAIPAEVRERTTIVLTADNGTDTNGTLAPWRDKRAKGTAYEAGVNVPLLVAGPLVRQPGSEVTAFVHLVDLFPTLATIAGIDVRALQGLDANGQPVPLKLDGHNLLPFLADPMAPPVREILFTELFSKEYPHSEGRRDRGDGWQANGRPPYAFSEAMVRDERWKLIRREEYGVETLELYDLEGRDVEGDDLLAQGPLSPEAQAAHDRLYAELLARLADQVYDIPNQPVYLADARIEPADAPPGADLTCVVGRVIDGDDDVVQLSYRWFVDEVESPITSSTLPAASFPHGALVRCIVSGADESGVSASLEAVATWSP